MLTHQGPLEYYEDSFNQTAARAGSLCLGTLGRSLTSRVLFWWTLIYFIILLVLSFVYICIILTTRLTHSMVSNVIGFMLLYTPEMGRDNKS